MSKVNPKPKSFIRQISRYAGDRLHIEIPKDKRDKFEPGDTVRVEMIE
jgi:urease beta subunit